MSFNHTEREQANMRILAKIKDPLARRVMENNLLGMCNPDEIPALKFPIPKHIRSRTAKEAWTAKHGIRKSGPAVGFPARREEAIRNQVEKCAELRHRLAAGSQLPERRY